MMNQLFFVWYEIITEQLTNLSAWSDRMRSSRLHQPPPSSAFLKILPAKQRFGLVTCKEPPPGRVPEQSQQYSSLQHNTVGGLPLHSCSEAVLQSSRQCLALSLTFQTLKDKFCSLSLLPHQKLPICLQHLHPPYPLSYLVWDLTSACQTAWIQT